MIRLVEKIVNSGVNGIVLLPLVPWLAWTLIGQAKETAELFKEV